ncbi:9 transmembrane domain [Cryptosporidium sp. chipmunk genotype I]|uniref:9 transmembrane domain n=1 Tax=Cryptosporidium sp. chipmunk genotype I TaxID=1280935 RepID=UPI00351A8510|nr:9 transmembrane domain [Cryptosporidium sp. chipmunk genotype I]
MKLYAHETNCSNTIENKHTNSTFNNQLKYLALLSTIKPLILWCTTSSILSLIGILFLYSKFHNGIITTVSASLFSNIVCQIVFFLLLFSRVMSITIEHYLTASLTLFNDLVITFPRYVLWELIFTSRWIWLSLHFFSATYSIFMFWNIFTMFLLELPIFLSTFFFVAGGLSFIRFFGKNQNIFLLSSQISLRPMIIKFNIKEHNNLLLQFFEITDYFIFNGCSGNIKNSLVFTILTLLITLPIYYFGINIPGISNFFNLINKFYSLRMGFKLRNELNSFIHIFCIYFTSFIVVSFYWYCIELQSANIRNFPSIDINGIFVKSDRIINDSNLHESVVPSDNYIRFITNLQKKFIFTGRKINIIQKICIKAIYSFYSIFVIFTILPVLFLLNLRKIKVLINILTKRVPINSNFVFEEWLVYEYKLFSVLDKLQKQLDNIFSTVLLLDSSIHTKVATINNGDFKFVVQSIGLNRRISFSQINIDDWFLHIHSLKNQLEKNNHIPKSINEWWYSNILFSDNLNNPKIKNGKKISGWDMKNSIMQHRSEIFCLLIDKFKNYCKKAERNLTNCTDNIFLNSKESEIIPQLIFLMQEMALYAIDLCYLYIYCYHRFIAKNLIINGLKSEWNAQTLNQYINLSAEVKNRIYFACEVGLLNSPYIHPVFEQEVIRLYKGIEDSLELLLSLL